MNWVRTSIGTILLVTALAALVSVSGCSGLPSVKYCDYVKYERRGNKADLEVKDCIIPSGPSLPGL